MSESPAQRTGQLYRKRYFDPDYRRQPKTNCWCEVCQQDLRPSQLKRTIMYELDTMDAIHADDWETAAVEITQRRSDSGRFQAPRIAWFVGYVGPDCAKKLGLEFTREA